MIRAAGRPATERLTFQNEILIFAEEDHKGTDFPNEIDHRCFKLRASSLSYRFLDFEPAVDRFSTVS